MRPSICSSARSMMCSSSAAFSAPEPFNAKQMSPRLRGEPPPFVRAQHSKSHNPFLFDADWAESKKGRKCDASGIDPLPIGPWRLPAVSAF